MAYVVSTVSRTTLVLGACVAVGLYTLRDREAAITPPAPRASAQAATPVMATRRAAAMPSLDLAAVDEVDDSDPEIEAADEPMRGHAPIESAEEFALVFSVGSTSYVRLSREPRATARGTAKLIEEDDTIAVVAPVATAALPQSLRAWAGRTVLVDGTCRARVVGFAEVARVSGDPPGTDDFYFGDDQVRRGDPPEWTVDDISDYEFVLAAKLDGCHGTWARSTEYSPPAIARHAEDPELETAALADLLARADYDPVQQSWSDSGGEGDWRDAVSVTTSTFQHPDTNERWVFAQAHYGGGGCGEPSVEVMAAYRASASGTLRRVADLEFAAETLQDVVDLDGDGQPELIVGDGDRAELVDLANNRHEGISVPRYHGGCGC